MIMLRAEDSNPASEFDLLSTFSREPLEGQRAVLIR